MGAMTNYGPIVTKFGDMNFVYIKLIWSGICGNTYIN